MLLIVYLNPLKLSVLLHAQCLRLLTHSFNREYSHVCVSASESKVDLRFIPTREKN